MSQPASTADTSLVTQTERKSKDVRWTKRISYMSERTGKGQDKTLKEKVRTLKETKEKN